MKNDEAKTMFKYSNEVQEYIDILGGTISDKSKKYSLDCLKLIPGEKTIKDKKYIGVYCGELPNIMYRYFEDYGLQGTFTYMEGGIFGLEPLALTHAVMMDYQAANNHRTIEENYNIILNNAREKMLDNVFYNSPDEEELSLTPFDKAVGVFLQENFDSKDFLDKCIFNATGYNDDVNGKCISFSWYTKEDPDTVYEIGITKKGYISSITFKKPGDRFSQKIEHGHVICENKKNKDTFTYCTPALSTRMEFDINRIYHTLNGRTIGSRSITDQDIEVMNTLMDSFIDKDLSFDEIKRIRKEHWG